MLPDPLHPAVVHFPIVLTMLAPLVAGAAIYAIRRGVAPLKAWGITTVFLAALVLSAWISTETGEQQEERVERVVSERPLETHEEAAELFLYASVGVLLVAVVGLARNRLGTVGRAAAAIGTVALIGAAWNVGHTGGSLVYEYGAASAYTGPSQNVGGDAAADNERGRARRGGDDDDAN